MLTLVLSALAVFVILFSFNQCVYELTVHQQQHKILHQQSEALRKGGILQQAGKGGQKKIEQLVDQLDEADSTEDVEEIKNSIVDELFKGLEAK